MLLAYIYRSITHRVHFLDKGSGDLFICAKDLFIEAARQARRHLGRWLIQGRLATDPKKAHPRISTTSGMPNAMVAHISSFAHGTSAWDLISL
jgi:hypothetical protein